MYHNQLEGKVDAIILTAGIGENGALPRENIFEQLHTINSNISIEKNRQKYDEISKISDEKSSIPAYIVRTNEELLIAQKVKKLLNN
jgi:acetate kinase